MHHQQPGNFQQPFYADGQQYALVPLNGSPAVMNSPQHHGMPPMGAGFGHSPGLASPQMLGGPAFAPGMNGFKCVHASALYVPVGLLSSMHYGSQSCMHLPYTRILQQSMGRRAAGCHACLALLEGEF